MSLVRKFNNSNNSNPNNNNTSIRCRTNNPEEDEKWQLLEDTHHELCYSEKCQGRRINGLFVCQFSNIPGSVYSQYLRHRRRLGAYKTKPCRNFFGSGYCHTGDDCPFYHSAEEQRHLPPSASTSLMMMDGGSSSGSDLNLNMWSNNNNNGGCIGNNNNHFPPIGHFGQQDGVGGVGNCGLQAHSQHQFHQPDNNARVHKALDELCQQASDTYDRLYKQLSETEDYMHSLELLRTEYQQQKGEHHQPNGNGIASSAATSPTGIGGDFASTTLDFLIGAAAIDTGIGIDRPASPQPQLAVGCPLNNNIANNNSSSKWSSQQQENDGNNNNLGVHGIGTAAGGLAASLVTDFSKSFHPFSESYPLKNMLNL